MLPLKWKILPNQFCPAGASKEIADLVVTNLRPLWGINCNIPEGQVGRKMSRRDRRLARMSRRDRRLITKPRRDRKLVTKSWRDRKVGNKVR